MFVRVPAGNPARQRLRPVYAAGALLALCLCLAGCGYLTPTATDALTPYVIFVTPTPLGGIPTATATAGTPGTTATEGPVAAGGILVPRFTPTPNDTTPPSRPSPTPAPPTATAAPAASPTPETLLVYTVDPGDTLSGIANHYNMDSATLAAFNGINKKDPIHIGQKLRIPKLPPDTPRP